jgi:hypothetical protein
MPLTYKYPPVSFQIVTLKFDYPISFTFTAIYGLYVATPEGTGNEICGYIPILPVYCMLLPNPDVREPRAVTPVYPAMSRAVLYESLAVVVNTEPTLLYDFISYDKALVDDIDLPA